MIGRLIALFMAIATPAAVQDRPVFRSDTRLVVLQVTVSNSRGEPVTTLDQQAFTVYEDGKRQPIVLFRRDDVPVSIGLLIDNSGSMRRVRSRVEAAALALARASNPQDEIFVVNFADKARVDVPLTSDIRQLEGGIGRIDSIGGTAMHDAIDLAESYLRAHATHERRILLVITDGNDNASVTPVDQVLKRAARSDTVIDAIGLFAEGDAGKAHTAHHELDRLAERTGGVVYYPAGIDQVEADALALAHQIRNQYLIAYAPAVQALDGSYRSIKVTARGGDKYTVRARSGYLATPVK